MILTIGTYRNKDALIKAVEKDHRINTWAKDLINQPRFKLSEKQDIELVSKTVKELTGKDLVTTNEIYKAIEAKGYSVCPDDTALYYRIAYPDQPMDEWQAVLSKPVADSDGDLYVLYVERDSGGSWVDGRCADPGDQWDGGLRLLVCRPVSLAPSTLSVPCDSEITLNGTVYIQKSDVNKTGEFVSELKAIRAEHLAVANKISGVLRKLTNQNS